MRGGRPEYKKTGRPLNIATEAVSMRKSFLIFVTSIGFALVALIFIVARHRQIAFNVQASSASHETQTAEASAQFRSDSSTPVAPKSTGAEPNNALQTAAAEKTEKAIQLVKALSEISLQPGELTPEQADQWKRHLEELIELGTASVPVLEQFFQTTGDIRLDSIAGGKLLEEPTLRIAFMKVLFDIPTPDNVELQERLLQITTDPDEIALLARQLELQEPGEHRDLIIQAANTALNLAHHGALPSRDPSRLNKVLADYGIPATK